MKDINGVDITSGSHVHIMGKSVKDPSYQLDVHCLVVGLRGRGIKFVDEVNGKEYPSTIVTEDKFEIWVLESPQKREVRKKVEVLQSPISQEQIDTIVKLKAWGWYGTWYKDVDGLTTTVRIDNPNDKV